jgi:hypothetical protein
MAGNAVGARRLVCYACGVNEPPETTSPKDAPPPGRLPWELHPALTEDRLRVCARMLANARRDALAMASYELGDDAWSVSCRAYAFGRSRLARAATSGRHNWLGVLDESNAFVFLIEDVPVRFYRGLAEEPTTRALRRHAQEARQLSLAFGDTAEGLVTLVSQDWRPLQSSTVSIATTRWRERTAGRVHQRRLCPHPRRASLPGHHQ